MNPTYFISFSAEICLVVTLLLLFIIELVQPNSKWLFKISVSGLVIAFLSLSFQTIYSTNAYVLINYSISGLNTIFKALLTLASLLCLLISQNYIICSGLILSEFLIFYINAIISSLFLCGANDLITLFVSIESLSLSSYLLAGYSKLDIRSNEAVMKYFLLGSASSAIIAYGFSWLYGLSQGQVQFSEICLVLSQLVDNSSTIGMALILIIVGISFKLGIVPFHQWSPDVYEGSPTPVVAFFSVVSKIAAFILCIKVFSFIFPFYIVKMKPILSALAAMTMIGGNLIALTQTNIKRLLAYSSISQVGYLMIAIIYGPSIGYVPTILYLLIYIFMNIGAFGSIVLLTLKTGTDQIRDFKGLYFRDPILTICLTICLLSLAGIPPFAGFFSKLYLFFLGWKDQLYWLVYIGLITSVVSIYYYLRIIKVLITPEKQDQSLYVRTYQNLSFNLIPHNSLEVSIRICVIFSTILGFVLSPLIQLTQTSLGNN